MDRTTLKSWFQRGKKPTASQFAALIDSFWHKDDTMSLHSIKGLNEALQTISGKQDKTDTTLQTADKTVVGAINEVNTKTSNIEREIGNEDLLSDHAQSIKGAIAEINTWRGNASQDIEHLVGDMPFKQDKTDNSLKTICKTIVGAINELWEKVEDLWEKYIRGIDKVTHAELVAMRDAGELIAGRRYRIIDFVTTTSQPDTRSAGHRFDIIVMADSSSTLNENATAIKHKFTEEELVVPTYFLWRREPGVRTARPGLALPGLSHLCI